MTLCRDGCSWGADPRAAKSRFDSNFWVWTHRRQMTFEVARLPSHIPLYACLPLHIIGDVCSSARL
jgi:hypothetical protein